MKLKLYASLIVIALVAGLFAWWSWDLRWRPNTIDRNQEEIAKLLEQSGWVSPGGSGPKLYMISFRTCPDCIRYKTEEFPKLQAAGVDTRVIMVIREDLNGAVRSTPVERATVAEIWANRSWPLLESWMGVHPEAWKPTGIPAADGDIARAGIVAAGPKLVADLTPLLRQNGIKFAYPLLIWWTKDGQMHGCACESPKTYAKVRQELGA